MPILIIRHVKYKRLGHITGILEELDVPFRSISLAAGDPLPKLNEVDGIISMGGPMSAYERIKYPWIEKEEKFLKKAHERGIPILGICLGGQILAQAFGAKVYKAPKGETGWIRLSRTTVKKDPMLEGLKFPLLFALHYDVFDVPKGAVNLFKSARTKHQMFRLGESTYGIQFHPEANEAMVRSVAEEYRENLEPRAAKAMLHDLKNRTAKGREFCLELLKRLFT